MTYPGILAANGNIVRGVPFGGTNFLDTSIDDGHLGELGSGVDISGQPISGTHLYAVVITPSAITASAASGSHLLGTYAAMTLVDSGTIGAYAWTAWERIGDGTGTEYRYGFDLSPPMTSGAAVGAILKFAGTDAPLANAYNVAAYAPGALTGDLPAHTAPSDIFDKAVIAVGFRSTSTTDKVTADPPYLDTATGPGLAGFAANGTSFYLYSADARDDPGSLDAFDDAYYHRSPSSSGETITSTTGNLAAYVALVASGTGPERPPTAPVSAWHIGRMSIGGPW